MRFTAAVLFAGVALASQSGGDSWGSEGGEGDQYTTVTDVKTISSCAPEVTNCAFHHPTTAATTTATSAPEQHTPGSKPPVKPSSSTTISLSKPTGGSFGNGSHPTTIISTTRSSPTGGVGSWPAGTWDDCECDEDDTCTSAGNASPTGGWTGPSGSGSGSGSGSTGSSSPVGGGAGGNGSVTTSSPTGIVTAGAGAAAPAFLAVVAGLVAFLA